MILDEAIDSEYDGIPITCYLKALALQYLINIPPSERALGRVILGRKKLQKLCGFNTGNLTIGSRTFWHFRNKYSEIFSGLIIKVLISLVLGGKSPNLKLPFVDEIKENEFNNNGNLIEWSIDAYRSAIIISLPWTEKDLSTQNDIKNYDSWKKQWGRKFRQTKDFNEFRIRKNQYDEEYKRFTRKTKKGFSEEIIFPIDVSISMISGEKIFFRLMSPNWLNKDDKFVQLLFVEDDSDFTSQPKNTYDKACNIIVLRELLGEKEILLSRRKTEGQGKGSFAVPGGKQQKSEALEECAVRELKEETGLILEKSRPVSLFYTLQESMGEKQVMSVGVLAETWIGQVETRESDKHEGWEWYKLNDLPSPIFEFSKIAITHLLDKKYPNLSWEDVEEKPDTQLSLFEV